MKRVYLILLSAFVILQSCSVSKKMVEAKPERNDYFIKAANSSNLAIDPIGNIYFVTNNRTLNKYKSDGTKELIFDTQLSGMIHSIDVNNPLYLMIYYRDGNKIQLLDRNLAPLEEIDIPQWTTNDITAAQISNDNNIWLYDNTDRKLKKYTRKGELILESLDLYGLSNLGTTINRIYEHENQVFLRNDEGKLIVLNNLGQYQKDMDYSVSIPIIGRKKQICAPMNGRYYCFRLDGNPFQESIALNELDASTDEAILYRYIMYEVVNGGIIKTEREE